MTPGCCVYTTKISFPGISKVKCRLLIFSKSTFSKKKKKIRNTTRVSNSLNLDQVGPGQGPNCLQRLSADKTSRQTSADPEGGQGVQTPPGKSQVIWVSIGNKQLDPPLEKVGPSTPSGTLKNDRFL